MAKLSRLKKTLITILGTVILLTSCNDLPRNERRKEGVASTYGIGKPSPDRFPDVKPDVIPYQPQFPNATIQHSPNKQPREVLGFYTDPEEQYPGSQPTVNANYRLMSSIAPFWYKLDDKRPGYLISSVSPDHQRQVIQNAHAKGLHVYLLVHNLFYETMPKGKQVARAILRDENNRARFIKNLRKEVRRFGYDGVNIDIENMYSNDRDAFSTMIRMMADALHRDGKLVTLSVPANSGDQRANGWARAFDYAQLGKSADRLVLMTYDEHNTGSSPGPVASLNWTESTIRYALKQGVPANRIMLGIAGYGWDWIEGQRKAVYSSHALIMQQKQKYNGQIHWDRASQTPHLTYIDENRRTHHAWFENSYSFRFKLDLVEKYNLQGIGIWRLGLEDPMYWRTIPQKIRVKKM